LKNKIRIIYLIILGVIGISIISPLITISRNLYVETGTIQNSVPLFNLYDKFQWSFNQYFIRPNKIGPFHQYYYPFINIFENTISTFTSQISGIILGRLNYLHIHAEVIKLVHSEGTLDISYFFNNFIGLIPRFLWIDKPIITNNVDVIGFQMGLQPSIDKALHFAIGLRPMGESFLIFSWYGILLSLPLAIFFYIVTFILNSKYSIYPFYLFYCVELIKNDSIHSIIPSFAHYVVGCIIFICLMFFVKITYSFFKKRL
jgi:hypothetical protein